MQIVDYHTLREYMSETHVKLLLGMVMGIDTPKSTFDKQLQMVGLTHMLVLSGSNISFLVRFFQNIIPTRNVRYFTLSTLCFLGCIPFVFGSEPSTIRAVSMATIPLIASLYNRANQQMHLVILCGLLMLIFDPSYLSKISFQLSFAAVIGITLFDQKELIEENGQNGIKKYIFEHLMFRGTPRFPDYDDALLSTGAENNADTDLDRTRYFEDIKAEHLDRVIEVEADRFKHLNFNRTAFNNELGPVRQEREKGIDNNPGGYLGEQLQDLAFTVHTYKHDTIGTKEDIIHMQYDDAYNFYNTFYNPKSIFIVVVGNFDRPKTVAKLDKEFSGDWGRKPFAGYAQPPTMEPPQEGPRRALLNWKDSLTPPMLSQGYHAPSFSLQNNDFCALELTEKLLFLESSPLSVRLIQKLALVQPGGFEGGVKRAKDPFLYYINATLRQGKTVKDLSTVEHEIEKELQRLRVNPVSARDLEKAKNNYVADILFSLKSAGSIARSIGELYVLTKDPQTLNQLIGCYRSVHANDVKRVVNTYLVPKNRNTVALLPKGVQ
jgi:zinc protease